MRTYKWIWHPKYQEWEMAWTGGYSYFGKSKGDCWQKAFSAGAK